jgi:hypothetical protein
LKDFLSVAASQRDAHLLPGEHDTQIDFLPIEADAPAVVMVMEMQVQSA